MLELTVTWSKLKKILCSTIIDPVNCYKNRWRYIIFPCIFSFNVKIREQIQNDNDDELILYYISMFL